jgi:hypothetical protein
LQAGFWYDFNMNDENEQSKTSPQDMITDEQRESIRKERRPLWENRIKEVAEFQDGAGNKMDEGMIETVVALNLNGITTTFSCEGHIDRLTMPSVTVETEGAKDKVDEANPEWRKERTRRYYELQARIQTLLDEFYTERPTEPGNRLAIENNSIHLPIGDIDDPFEEKPLTKAEREALIPKITAAQKEMRDFTEFLKKRFFEIPKSPI